MTDPAQELIEEVNKPRKVPEPRTEGWRESLLKIIEHNDGRATTKRISAGRAIKMLQEHYGWTGASNKALNRLCEYALGRKGYSQP